MDYCTIVVPMSFCWLLRGIFLGLICFPVSAHADVVLSRLTWEISLQAKKQKGVYHHVQSWLLPPRFPLESRSRILVTLVNKGPREEEAVLLRYVLSARLVPISSTDPGTGTWTIPFLLEDRHVPRALGVHSVQNIPIYFNRKVSAYLKKAYQAGFWPDALKIQVLVEPRRGDTLKGHLLDAILPIIWRPAPASGIKTERRHE